MTNDQFETLLTRRAELRDDHERACLSLEEEPGNRLQHQECLRLYAEIEALQEQIDAEIAAERAAENQTEPEPASAT